MKKFTQIVLANLALVILLTCITSRLYANGAANGNAGVILQLNGGAKTIYKVYDGGWGNDGGTGWYGIQGAPTFSGTNLGNLNSLTLNGMAIVGWTDNADFVSGQIQYKIWLNGTSEPGSVTGSFNVGGYGSACSVQDVQSSSGTNRKVGWDASSVDLLSGLTPGVYNLKIYPYGQMRYNCGSYNQVNNAAVTATFNVNPTVTFNANGGSGSMSTQNVNYNTATALNSNAFTYTSYTFNGWNTAANGSGASYANSGNVTFTANTTLYAQWLPYPTITSFKVSGTTSTNGYIGQTLQIIGTSFSSGINTVTFNGGSSISATYISSTEVDVVIPSSATTGLVALTTAGNLTSGVSYTILGYISTASTDWNTGTTWLGNSIPTASANVTIANAVTVTGSVSNAVNTLTINSGSSLTFSSTGALTATTVTNGGTLAMSAGTLTIASGGTFTNNTNGTSFGGGTVSFNGAGTINGTDAITFNNLGLTTGTLTLTTVPTINGTFTLSGGSVSAAPKYGTSSLLKYNTGTTYGRSNEWSATTGTVGTTAGLPQSVQISNNTTLNFPNGSSSPARTIAGNFTIDAGSAFYMDYGAPLSTGALTIGGNVTANGNLSLGNQSGGDIYVGGNWSHGGGTFNANGRALFMNGSLAQTISNTNSTNESFPYLIINNTSGGVSLNSPVSITNTLTLTSGILTTTSINKLSVTNTAISAISATTSFSASTFINGPLTWSLPNSSASNYIFPVGVGTTYLPFSISSPIGTSPIVTVQAYAADVNVSASYGSNLSGISHSEYWIASNTGTFTSGTILLAKAALGSNTAIANSATTTSFTSFGGTIGSNLIASNTLISTSTVGSLGYFVMAVSALPIITSFTTANNNGTTTSGYVGTTVTITGTNLGGATALSVGGTPVTIASNTSTQITFVAIAGLSGTISITNPIGTGISSSSYADLGYISTASTDWNTGTTWLGNSVPTAIVNVTIANAVTVTGSVSNAVTTLTINGSSSLTFSSSGSLTATTVTNNGTLAMSAGTLTIASGGTLTNNTNGTLFSGGTVSFSGTGNVGGSNPITFNNLLSLSGVVNLNTAPTINGTLTINTSGGVGVNAPYYGTSSTLFYNASTTTGSPYSRTYEWIAGTTNSSSAGYPNNVTIGSSSVGCVLNINNVAALQMGGILTIGSSSGPSCSLQMNESTTPYPLTVVGNVSVNTTGTLLLGNLVSSYAGDLYLKGSFTNIGTFNNNGRAVFFNGSSAQTISGSALNTSSGTSNNFSYLYISSTSNTVSLANNITVSSTLNIASGATLSDGGNTLSVSGASVVNNGTHSSTGSGKIKLTGSSAGISGTGAFQNLEISLASNSNIATISNSFSVSGNLTVTQGRVQPSGAGRVITMSGTLQSVSVANTNGFIYGADNSPNDLSLAINSGSTTTFTGTSTTTSDDGNKFYNITVNGTLILSSGILCKFGSFTVAGTLQINSGGYIQSSNATNGASASSNKAASYSSGTLIYNTGGPYSTTDYEWPTSSSPTNITVQNSTNVTLNSSKTIAGTLTLTAGTFAIGSNSLTLSGSYIAGTANNLTTTSSSSLLLNCTGSGPFTLPNFTAINNLTLNTSGQAYNLNSSPTISGTLTLTAGTFAVGSNTLTLSGPYIAGTVNNLTTTSSSSLVLNCTGTGPFTLPNFTAINGLTINSGTNTYNLNSSPTVSGAVTLTAGKLSIGSNTLTLSSTLTCSATNSLVGSTTSNLTIQGTVGSVYFSGTTSLNNITVNSGSMILRTALTMSGTVLVAGGKFEVGAITQSIPAFNMTSGTLQLDASSTVRFTGTYSASSGSTLNAYAIPTIATNSTISLEVTNNTTRFPGSGVIVNNGLSLGPVTTCMGNLVMALPNPANSVTWKSAGSTVLIYGILSLNSGVIVTTTNTDVLSAASVTNAGGAASYVSGPLGISATTTSAVTFPIGKGGNYRPVTFAYSSANAGNAAVIEQFEASFPGTIPSDVSFSRFGTRYYNIIQYQTGYAYTIGLNNGGATPTGTVKIIRRDGASVTTNANATSFSSPTYTTSSSYTASTYLSNDVSLVETAIPLTITASAQSKTYGAALSPLAASYSVSGLAGSDNISSVTLTNSNTGNGNSPVTDVPGTYTITPSAAVFSSGVSGAYNITYNTGSLTVNAGTAGVWIGIASTDFNAVTNWQSYSTPISSTNVSIGTGTTYLPLLTATSSINNLSLASGTAIGLNGQSLTINGVVSGSGTITSTSASSLTIGGTAGTLNFTSGYNSIKNLTLNSSSTATLGTQLNIVGGSTPGVVTIGSIANLTTGGNLTLKSDVNGTARIDQVLGSISGNVTVERYISSKASRRFSFIGSPVTQTVRNAWQQQIYVTGSGTGGTPCGSTSGNGGTTDKYNSNGFDATINNANSILTYAATTTNNSHYVSIANTGVSLTPGTGYSVNIRGDRNSGNTNCSNQLTNTSPMAPEAVTLSASGTVTTGDLAVALNDKTVHKFTLLSNPYPSQISFTALQASNSIINNKMWSFSPFGSGNFTTYANGAIVNGASGFDNTNGDYIASGQAFFVEANTNGSVTFHESHKCSGVVPNTNYFGVKSDKMIRVGLYNNTNTRLDEALVRYNSFGSKEYVNEWDATSLSLSSQALVTFKGVNKLAIATHPLSVSADTTQLGVAIKAGSYTLGFSQLESIDSLQSITLVDNYLGVTSDVRQNSSYSFNVTSDSASKGTKRFKIILSGAYPLAVNFVSINATQKANGVAVEWQVANEQSIASYIIERSTDGVHFTIVNTVAAKGKSSYNAQDLSVSVGAAKLYYRIKSLGFDGAYKYSAIATVVTHDSKFVGLTIYPNPVQKKLNITSKSILIGSTCFVKISTTAGTVAFSKSNVTYTGNAISLDVAKLAAGVYMVELTDAMGNKLVDKFIKE